jgi:hypothetical protein
VLVVYRPDGFNGVEEKSEATKEQLPTGNGCSRLLPAGKKEHWDSIINMTALCPLITQTQRDVAVPDASRPMNP